MIILALGTNLGDRVSHLRDAINALNKIGNVLDISPVYETEPWGFKSDNGFLNIVITFKTELTPINLLSATQKIEKELGRKTKTSNEYADRPIDIDIIDYNGEIISSEVLTTPHKLMHERNFVLYPLTDIAPEWIHPILHKNAMFLKETSKDTSIPLISKFII